VKVNPTLCSILNKILEIHIIPISTLLLCFLLISKVPKYSCLQCPKFLRVRKYLTGTKVPKDQGGMTILRSSLGILAVQIPPKFQT
jgi:hypothetical protein